MRNTFSINARDWSDCIGRVLHVRSEITHGCKAHAGDDRIGNNVNVLVDLPGMKPTVQMDVPIARR